MPPALAQDDVVAIDGKTSRYSGKVDAAPLHLVSAFAAGSGLVLVHMIWLAPVKKKGGMKVKRLIAATSDK